MYVSNRQSLRLVLASRSPSRRAILEGAGFSFSVVPADLDETALLKRLASQRTPMPKRAETLAIEKAKKAASEVGADAVVIGADQILEIDGEALESPRTQTEARERLLKLRGRSHRLVCGAAVVRGEAIEASLVETVGVFVRDFTDRELDHYLDSAPASALNTVGAYALEGLGARLIERIEGDWFSALGLPLWRIQSVLRRIEDRSAQ